MASRLSAIRALSAPQRAQRRHDLRLAADLLRRQIDRELTGVQPAADRALAWVDAALWLRRQWQQASAGKRRVAAAVAVAGGIAGVAGVGGFLLRHWRWLRGAAVAWQAWRQSRA